MSPKHTTAQLLGRRNAGNITISNVEYDSLLRVSREFELLKDALFAGGLTPETLALLIAGGSDTHQQQQQQQQQQRQKQQGRVDAWADECDDQPPAYYSNLTPLSQGVSFRNSVQGKSGPGVSEFHPASANRPSTSDRYQAQTKTQTPNDSRQVSWGIVPSSVPEGSAFDEANSLVDDGNTELDPASRANDEALRTLYFVGFNACTSYQDLLSVIKGGQILSINMRSEKSATVTFLDAAPDYLAWVKRNDLYVNGKRIEVRWANRQFHVHAHISNKIANGATRNIVIRRALDKGLTAERIREDMEHIHDLVIIDITYRNGDAYMSTNSVHNALFARTCMMSRTTYRGCKIEFYPDECDVPLPARAQLAKVADPKPVKMSAPFVNRFDMLRDNTESGSDEENRDPRGSDVGDSSSSSSAEEDDGTLNFSARHGVRLSFLDDDIAS